MIYDLRRRPRSFARDELPEIESLSAIDVVAGVSARHSGQWPFGGTSKMAGRDARRHMDIGLLPDRLQSSIIHHQS